MELAIPLIVLGGMYTISKQRSQSKNDTFVNMGKPPNKLPNVPPTYQNYPSLNENEFLDVDNKYPSNIESTNAFLNQSEYIKKEKEGIQVGSSIQPVYNFQENRNSTFDRDNLTLSVSKGKDKIYNDNSVNILDNYSGQGSQYKHKQEQAPLFAPQEHDNWNNGTPNMSGFFQSRVNPSMKNNMVKPFESIQVGPGLDKGYVSNGSGGYNSGMEAREKWMPKNADELRNAARPKEEHMILGRGGPISSIVKNTGVQGVSEKQRPDTYYDNTADRWFTTTGASIAPPTRGILKKTDKDDTSAPIISHVKSSQQSAERAPELYTNATRVAIDKSAYAPPCSTGGLAPISNANHNSYQKTVNNRQLNDKSMFFGPSFSETIGAVIAPIMDVLKPCKKEEHVYNARVYGNMGNSELSSGYTNAPDIPDITTKETTLYSSTGFIERQGEGAYLNTEQQIYDNQRDSTTNNYRFTGGIASATGHVPYDAAYNTTIDDKKETSVQSRVPSGNTQIFNPTVNMQISKQNPTVQGYMGGPKQLIGLSADNHGIDRQFQTYEQQNRIDPSILSALKDNPYTLIGKKNV